jgi:uncharacterized peroxidase-related enzyme
MLHCTSGFRGWQLRRNCVPGVEQAVIGGDVSGEWRAHERNPACQHVIRQMPIAFIKPKSTLHRVAAVGDERHAAYSDPDFWAGRCFTATPSAQPRSLVHGETMSRVSIKTKDDLPANLRPLWDKMTTYGAFENQAGVMAHRPPIFEHIWSLLVDLANEAVLSKRHLELALVTVSLLNKCTYCVSHHAPKLAIQGVSEEGAQRLLDYKDHPELDDVDRLVVEYAIAVTNNWNKTRDEVFTRLREHFSEAQIVELTWRIALCGAFNRFNDILQFDIEQGVPVREAAE